MATNGTSEAPSSSAAINTPNSSGELSKDEVGWYFVEQYYTTLSKSPDRLHLFYNKRSQFVSGVEAEVAPVSVGRQAIQARIKELDFQDTKVRVSNVDSQASFDNIVVQVIGEVSIKAAEPKKFVQTFVLAQQPSGYYVLNDIFRYIDEEVDAEAAEAPAATEEAPVDETPVEAPVEAEPVPVEQVAEEETPALDTQEVEQKLEEVVADKVEGDAAEAIEVESPAATKVDEAAYDAAAKELAEEDAKADEKPVDPTPTPVVVEKVAAPVAPAPVQPAAPPKPMTWASRAAAAAGPRPVVPLPKTATPSTQRAAAPAAAAAASVPAAAPAAAPQTSAKSNAAAPAAETAAKDSEWQTAGADSKRQVRPVSVSAPPVEKEGTLGYVKYVTDKVQEEELKKALEAHGELAYFDINRQKNCAFVEYKSAEGLAAALAANPHTVTGEQIMIEQRRPKANAYGGNFSGGRGGPQRGRGGFDGRSGGAQGGSRGNFGGQNRGRAPRGRGGAQATNA